MNLKPKLITKQVPFNDHNVLYSLEYEVLSVRRKHGAGYRQVLMRMIRTPELNSFDIPLIHWLGILHKVIVANRYIRIQDQPDLFQLMAQWSYEAIPTYNPKHGCLFKTYAEKHINLNLKEILSCKNRRLNEIHGFNTYNNSTFDIWED